jgi:hypothetical protein
MEFSYKITEAEYVQACKLGRKVSSRSLFRLVMFWVFVLVCLMMLWGVVRRNSQQPDVSDQPAVTEQSSTEPENNGHGMRAFLVNIGPFVLVAGIWVVVLFGVTPMRLRRIYRKDPFMQGQFTVSILPESISIQNTAGSSSHTEWNVYERWREGKDVIVLKLQSGAYSAMSVAGLSNAQRDELRGILSAALPKK